MGKMKDLEPSLGQEKQEKPKFRNLFIAVQTYSRDEDDCPDNIGFERIYCSPEEILEDILNSETRSGKHLSEETSKGLF